MLATGIYEVLLADIRRRSSLASGQVPGSAGQEPRRQPPDQECAQPTAVVEAEGVAGPGGAAALTDLGRPANR